jgi:uncharacterized protein (TIGR02246 family)
VSIDHEDHSKTDDLEWSKIMHDEKTTANRRADEAAVRSLYQELMDGWNRGSGEAFAAAFAHDGDLVAFDGTHFKGREEIAPFHQQLFDKWLKGTRLVGRVEEVRFLGPDVAVMHAVGSTVMRGKSEPSPERDSIQTLVATRERERRMAHRRLPEHAGASYGPKPDSVRALGAHGPVVEGLPSQQEKDTRVSPYRTGDHIRSVA